MNFQTIFEDLSRLYEEAELAESKTSDTLVFCSVDDDHQKAIDEVVSRFDLKKEQAFNKDWGFVGTDTETKKAIKYLKKTYRDIECYDSDYEEMKADAVKEGINFPSASSLPGLDSISEDVEDAEDEDVIEIEDDETSTSDEDDEIVEANYLVLKCENCGGLVIKHENEIDVDEETDIANVKDTCAFCGEAGGYKVIGSFAPIDEAFTEDSEDADDINDDSADAVDDSADESKETPIEEGIFGKRVEKIVTPGQLKKGDKIIGDVFGSEKDYWSHPGKVKSVSKNDDGTYDVFHSSGSSSTALDTKFIISVKESLKDTLPEEDEELNEFLDANVDVDLDAQDLVDLDGGKGNDVSVLGRGGSSVDEACGKEDKELNELFGFGKKKKKNDTTASDGKSGGQERKVSFEIYDENGTKKFATALTELPGKISAEEQLKYTLIDSYPNLVREYKNSSRSSDWTYTRKSTPASSFDTRREFVSKLYL